MEIGCGDGYLTEHFLRKIFKNVYPIIILPRAKISGVSIASGENLPFPNKYFGLIYSSNVLEHINDLDDCLEELHRTLKDDGIMIHSMPSISWKLIQLFFYPLFLIKTFL